MSLQRVPALAPFGVRSFRFQWPADLATSWAVEMETIILGWYVLVETGSVLWLTLYASLQYIGTLAAPMFGVAGDRIGQRTLLCLMRAHYATLALILMTLALTGWMAPAPVFAIAALSGLVRPSDLGVRSVMIANTMPSGMLTAALSLSRTTSDSARIAGALLGAGLVHQFGIGHAYIGVAGLYWVSLLLTLGGGAGVRAAHPRPSPWRDLKDGIAYLKTAPHLLGGIAVAMLVNLTAFPFTNGLLPYVAREIYGLDQTGLGGLAASFAVGALMGSIGLSLGGRPWRPARMMIVATLAWYGLLFLFSQATSPVVGALLLAAAGFCQSLSMVPLSIVLLRASDPAFRGCVMGMRMLAIYTLPLGLMTAGPLIDGIGYAATAGLYCAIGLAATLALAIWWRSALWRPDAPGNAL